MMSVDHKQDLRLAPLRLVSGFVILLKTLIVQNNNQAITFTSSAGMKMNMFGVLRIKKREKENKNI